MSLTASLKHPLRTAVVLLAGASLLLAACDGTDAAPNDGDATATPTVTNSPTPTGTHEPAAGGGIEPANPEEPPLGDLNSGSGSVSLGLGTYCWSPPTGSGKPALCADAIGIVTSLDDLDVTAGETLTVTGDLTMPPMYIQSAMLYLAPDEPVTSSDTFRAWSPADVDGQVERMLDFEDHAVTLPDDLEHGRYVLAVNYTAGPDRGSEATYGALLVVE